MALIGRLQPGVTAAQAQAETRTIATELTREQPDRNSFEGFVKPLADQVNGRMRPALWVPQVDFTVIITTSMVRTGAHHVPHAKRGEGFSAAAR